MKIIRMIGSCLECYDIKLIKYIIITRKADNC
jgi:hypothetical protein